MTAPWVEKYRPLGVDEVVGNTKTVHILSGLVDKNVSIPNLLICGPHGCGKTVCVDILCDKLITDNREARILRSSSFDERGIDYIRTTVKNFARAKVGTDRHGPIVKIVVLDEADSISPGAFQPLRRIMEVSSATTRFIIICNNSTRIIEPIQSRCSILRFGKVEGPGLRSRLSTICDMAGVGHEADGLDALVCVADGDMRTAINSLGSTASGFCKVTAENVYKTCDTPQPSTIAEMVDLLRNKESYVRACEKLKALCDDGYCPSDIVSTFFKTLASIKIEETQRLDLCKAISLAQATVLNGGSTYLQLAAMLWDMCKILTVGQQSTLCGKINVKCR